MIDFVGALFALLVAAGGVMGYVCARSRVSFYSGILYPVSRVALGVGGACLCLFEPQPIVQLPLLAVLIMVMIYRYYSTRAFMLAGMIILLAFGVALWTSVAYRDYLSMGRTAHPTTTKTYNVTDFTVIIVNNNSKHE